MPKLLDNMNNVNNIVNINQIIKNVKTQGYFIIVKLLIGSVINDILFVLASTFFYIAGTENGTHKYILNIVGVVLLVIPFIRLIEELQSANVY